MGVRIFTAALLALALAAAASAQVLAITAGGRRIIDREPDVPETNCLGWTFGPSPRLEDDGRLTGMYTVSDQLAKHCQLAGLDSPQRFGDAIQYHARRDDGTWSEGVNVVDRRSLPWMNDSAYLNAHPATFVGHLASPSVVRLDGRYYMAFTASVDDRNLCAGEHYAGNPCGSCFDPWSYFVVMWAVSDDGVDWRIRQRAAGDGAFLGRPPDLSDRAISSQYKGLTRVALVPHEENRKQYFYIAAQYWARFPIKVLMFRVARDPDDPWGITGDPELWSANRRAWVACPNGRVPDFAGDAGEFSIASFTNFLGSIVPTSVFGDARYVALSSASSYAVPGSGGIFNRIAYQTSRNLIEWTPSLAVRSAIPFFADGFGYDVSVIDPVAVDENDGSLHLFFASADGDSDHGIDRDGHYDCELDPGIGPTAPYVGTGIYEAVVEPMTLRATSTRLQTPRLSMLTGEGAHYSVRVTAADGSTPVGNVVVVDAGRWWRIVPLVNGAAAVELPLDSTGEHRVYAVFDAQAGWDASRSNIVTQTVMGPRRRAVRPR